MPFEILRNDIVNMQVDAIVNTANPRPVIGAGTDAGIHKKAGPKLLEARQKIGEISVGSAAITPGFGLHARYVIHTVGPVWQDGNGGEEALLRKCYDSALALAAENECSSVAFPLISSGNYGFPKDIALRTAIAAFSDFLLTHEMQVYLVVFDKKAFSLSEQLFRDVKSYIDENYVAQKLMAQRPVSAPMESRRPHPFHRRKPEAEEAELCSMVACAPAPMEESLSLDQLLKQTDAGFTETLFSLIDKTGKKDSEIYNRANITRQHFSKIRNNPSYKPTKATAIALAIALELTLEETRDLIGRAGYALTNSSKFDVIIMYFIRQGNYNMFDINSALFQFDQSLLGYSLVKGE